MKATVNVDGDGVTIVASREAMNQVAAILHISKTALLNPSTLDLRAALDNALVGANVKRVEPGPGTPDASLDRVERILYGAAPERGRLWIAHPGSPLPRNRLGTGSTYTDRWPAEWIAFGADVESPRMDWACHNMMWVRTDLTLPDTIYMIGWECLQGDVRLVFTKVRLLGRHGSLYEFALETPDSGLKPWLAFVAVGGE